MGRAGVSGVFLVGDAVNDEIHEHRLRRLYLMRMALVAALAPMATALLFVFAAYPWPCLAAYIGWALAGPVASTVLLAILVSR